MCVRIILIHVSSLILLKFQEDIDRNVNVLFMLDSVAKRLESEDANLQYSFCLLSDKPTAISYPRSQCIFGGHIGVLLAKSDM